MQFSPWTKALPLKRLSACQSKTKRKTSTHISTFHPSRNRSPSPSSLRKPNFHPHSVSPWRTRRKSPTFLARSGSSMSKENLEDWSGDLAFASRRPFGLLHRASFKLNTKTSRYVLLPQLFLTQAPSFLTLKHTICSRLLHSKKSRHSKPKSKTKKIFQTNQKKEF